MSKEVFNNLESIWKKDESGVEYVNARDLAKVLGYIGKDYWRHFKGVVEKAKISCNNNKIDVLDHFADVSEMIQTGKTAQREVNDVKLTRYACYLTAQNGDSRKAEVAFAQGYFATQTRKFELVEQRIAELERLQERRELKEEEKIFSQEIYQRGVDESGFARIRSKGDEVLFGGNTTAEMKNKLGVPENKQNRPLADFLDPVLVTAKKFAMQVSNIGIKEKNLQGEKAITQQHQQSNQAIRNVFIEQTGIKPESLPPSKDIKVVEKQLNQDLKTISTKKSKDFDR